MGFPRQEHWTGLPFPSPGDPPDSGVEPLSLALAGVFFTTEPPEKPDNCFTTRYMQSWTKYRHLREMEDGLVSVCVGGFLCICVCVCVGENQSFRRGSASKLKFEGRIIITTTF